MGGFFRACSHLACPKVAVRKLVNPLLLLSVALATFVLVRMAAPKSTKFASFEVPGQQHSTIKLAMNSGNMEATGKEREDKLKIQDLAKETLCAGGCGVEVLWRDFGNANSDLHERIDVVRIGILLVDLVTRHLAER